MKQIIDLNKDLLVIISEHASEFNEIEELLIADEDSVYECIIHTMRKDEPEIDSWKERKDLCVISIVHQDENGAVHYDNEIVTYEQAKIAHQFNKTVEIIRQNKQPKEDLKMAKKYICPICGYIHEATEQPAQCPACYGDKLMKEIDHFETEWFGPYEREMVVTTDGKRYMI